MEDYTSRETDLLILDATPSISSNAFLDLRRQLVPPTEGFQEELDDKAESKPEASAPSPVAPPPVAETEDEKKKRLGHDWSDRDRKRMVRSSEFFKKRGPERAGRRSKKAVSVTSSTVKPSAPDPVDILTGRSGSDEL